jgi:peroxiredoxin Q/BCP
VITIRFDAWQRRPSASHCERILTRARQKENFLYLNANIKKTGAVVLGVSKDGAESHKKFTAKYKLPFVLLSDPNLEVMKKYGAYGKKMMYGKEVQGTIRSTVVIGPKGEVVKHWPTVRKAEAHPEEVLAFLKSL